MRFHVGIKAHPTMAPLVPGCCPPNMRHGDTLGLFPQRRKSATVKDAAEITAIATNTMMISRSSSRTWQSEHDWTCLATRQRENLTRFGHRQCRFFELGIHRCSWRDYCVAFKSATRDFRPVRNGPSDPSETNPPLVGFSLPAETKCYGLRCVRGGTVLSRPIRRSCPAGR